MYIALVEEYGKTAHYQPMSRDDIEAGKGKLGVFYLKADQRKEDEKCYILIDIFNNKVNDCNECPDPNPVLPSSIRLRNTPEPDPVMKTVMSAKNATSRNILMHSMAGDKLIV